MRYDGKVDLLSELPLFRALSRKHVERVSEVCTETTVKAGTLLCEEGTSGREFFVVIGGTATVSVKGTKVRTMGPGDFFGEISLLRHERRTATVTADGPLDVLVMSIPEFNGLLDAEPHIKDVITQTVEERMNVTEPKTPTA